MSNTSGAFPTFFHSEYILASGISDQSIAMTAPALNLSRGNGIATSRLTMAALIVILATTGTATMAQNSLDSTTGFSITSSIAVSTSETIKLKERFTELAAKWRDETGMISSTSKIVMHPAYQSILAMGERALPYILNDLRQEPDHWFYALGLITDGSPVKAEDAGDMQKMADSWVQWGIESGYIV